MGAVFSLKFIKSDLNSFRAWTIAGQIQVIGADDEAEVDFHEYRFPDKMVIMMGSERQGFLPQHAAVCNQMISIPMVGRCDSLNLAVATSVILYEVFNQRRKG
jgi:TrmH family RNA methyltransferase